MSRISIAVISILAVSTVGLAVALGVVLASDDDGRDNDHRMAAGYAGMMGAMEMMDSEAMLERMREILGEERYAAVLEHMQAHRNGTAEAHPSGVDGMMHEMMDGMMSMMPPDGGGHMFPNDQMPMPGMPGDRN